ncbi:MAG TPA: VCBS repeat-containing protein [Chthoniobacteraceae bacterium]|jgi:hypothetical protein
MNPLLPTTLLISAGLLLTGEVQSGSFEKKQLTDQFWAEGANVGDFNRDGQLDLVYGPYWWAGPDFKERHEYAPATQTFKVKKEDGTEQTIPGFEGALGRNNAYSKNFFAFTHDFNADGWTDILILGFPGEASWWFENPQGKGGEWKRHTALDVTENESPTFLDLTGDGKPELVCSSGGHLGFAEPDSANPTAKWKWRPISPKGRWQRFTHGIGVGDVNGDGRMDLLENEGWWEQPESLAGDPVWKKHDALFGSGGAQMFAYDVNGDGKNDVITSLEAHGYGVAWFEQTNDGGAVGWTKHLIVGKTPQENPQGVAFSQPHALALADMDGDGLLDLVTGKRFWAHGPGGDPEPNATPVLYWFQLQRSGGKASYTAHLIDDASGVGTQVVTTDVNGDKKPDVVVGNKRGAFLFQQR